MHVSVKQGKFAFCWVSKNFWLPAAWTSILVTSPQQRTYGVWLGTERAEVGPTVYCTQKLHTLRSTNMQTSHHLIESYYTKRRNGIVDVEDRVSLLKCTKGI